MFWLAGLLGFVALSAVALVDGSEVEDAGEDDPADITPERDPITSALNLLQGSDASEQLDGSPGADALDGRGGADLLIAAAGDDLAEGGGGADTVLGLEGDDALSGGPGNDLMEGGTGDDTLTGDGGDDRLQGDPGADHLNGSEGNDTLKGGDDADTLEGGLGDDSLSGDEGHDLLMGGAGADVLDGTGDAQQSDHLNGGAGDDVLRLGPADLAHGGTGADQFVLTKSPVGDPVPEVLDFIPQEDALVFVWDDANGGAAPEVEVREDPQNAGQLQVWLDEQQVAQVSGAAPLSAAEITLIPRSAALASDLIAG